MLERIIREATQIYRSNTLTGYSKMKKYLQNLVDAEVLVPAQKAFIAFSIVKNQ